MTPNSKPSMTGAETAQHSASQKHPRMPLAVHSAVVQVRTPLQAACRGNSSKEITHSLLPSPRCDVNVLHGNLRDYDPICQTAPYGTPICMRHLSF